MEGECVVIGLRRLSVKRQLKEGLGPFQPAFLQALLDRECMRCGGHVAEVCAVSNSVVVERGSVALYCRACRGVSLKIDDLPDTGLFDAVKLIAALRLHRCAVSGEKLDWFEALHCMRLGYAYFQSIPIDARRAFRKPRFFSEGYVQYGVPASVANCPECGASWRHSHLGPKNELPTSACGHCGITNNLQWHMRMGYEEERSLLFS